jgi:hypothetical protein
MSRRGEQLIIACVLPLLFSCSNITTTGTGGSSQTVNARIIVIDTTARIIIDDSTAGRRGLHVYATDYMPSERIGYTDSIESVGSAALSWKAPKQDRFHFLITLQPSGNACFLMDIALRKGACDTIACKLGPCRDIIGSLAPKDSTSALFRPFERYNLSIFGSPFSAITDSSCGFVMKNVPFGGYTISIRPLSKKMMIHTIDYSVMIDSVFGNEQLSMFLP